MISRDSFITIVNALDKFWNEKNEHLVALGIFDNYFHEFADEILTAIEEDIDPKHTARTDDLTYDCGTYICEWLFGQGEFQETCPNAGALYDYIVAKYETTKMLKSNEENK